MIAIHSFTGFELMQNTITYHLAIIWRQIVGCAVPIFLAISGYFMGKKQVSTKSQYISFLKRQMPRVYIPMLIWSIPYLFLSIYSERNVLFSIIFYFAGGFTVYYFIALIVQYYMLLPILQKMGGNLKGLIISAVVSSVCMLILFYLTMIRDLSFPLIVYAGPFPVWMVFFVLGIYLGHNDRLLASKRRLFIFVFLGLIISVAETYLHIYISDSLTGLGIKAGAFIYSFAVILLLFSYKTTKSSNSQVWHFFVYLGKISFGVYLTHMLFLIYLIRPIVGTINTTNFFFNQFLMILLTTFCCVIFISIVRRVNKPFAVKYLGF